jgi:hypothetical protein
VIRLPSPACYLSCHVNRVSADTIRQIEFELEKAEHGFGMPYDA